MKASVLSIGTELTAGQIFNKNAQWISEKLQKFGIETSSHLTVPDEKNIILKSLEFIESEAQLLFVTGGLGPTSDDFTRDVLAEWAKQELHYDEASWKHIESILTPRGIPLREMQKQQCYFPKNARVLTNSAGTANAFSFDYKNIRVYVLPGPPREIEAIWTAFIHSDLLALTKNLDAWLTMSWDTLGLGESEIAHLTETALGDSKIEKGYRVHLPYVEVKLSFKKSETEKYQKNVTAVDQALTPWTITKNEENLPAKIFTALAVFNQANFADEVTEGYFFNRIKEQIKTLPPSLLISYHNRATDFTASSKSFSLSIQNDSLAHAKLTLKSGDDKKEILITTPFDKPVLHERKLQYVAEMALIEAAKFLKVAARA